MLHTQAVWSLLYIVWGVPKEIELKELRVAPGPIVQGEDGHAAEQKQHFAQGTFPIQGGAQQGIKEQATKREHSRIGAYNKAGTLARAQTLHYLLHRTGSDVQKQFQEDPGFTALVPPGLNAGLSVDRRVQI